MATGSLKVLVGVCVRMHDQTASFVGEALVPIDDATKGDMLARIAAVCVRAAAAVAYTTHITYMQHVCRMFAHT